VRVVLLALILAIVPPAAAGPRRGKIVRVERPRTGARGVPRLCQFVPSDISASCFGQPPAVGETGTLLASTGIVSDVRVKVVEPLNPGGAAFAACTEGLWRLEVELADVRTDLRDAGYGAFVVFDVGLSQGARIADSPPAPLPSGLADEQPVVAISRDGRDAADFVVTWRPCPGMGTKTTNSATYCVDFWAETGSSWSKLRGDTVSWCN